MTQHMSSQNLKNCSCGLATAVSGGKNCYKSVFLSCDGKRQEMISSVSRRLFQMTGAASQKARNANAVLWILEKEPILSITRT